MKIVCLLLACLCTLNLTAQDKLVVMGKAPNYYVVYATNGSESLQNLSNQFGFSVAKLSSYNTININPNVPFPKATAIRIPVTKDNLLQHPGESSAPVVHIIHKGDNLYRLSIIYNKVPLASLREWNHLKKDIVKEGQQVIIGFMVNASTIVTADKKNAAPVKDIPTINNTPKEAPAIPATTGAPGADPAKKYTEKKQPVVPVQKDQRADGVPGAIASTDKPAGKPALPKEERPKELAVASEYLPKEGDEGYFASGYAEHGKEVNQQFRSGDAAIFKTISGWTDRKFYVLMNDIAPKTIVRITGTANKSICAMVLGPLQETKGASGLLLRVSNSAASALGITDQKFTITITYFE